VLKSGRVDSCELRLWLVNTSNYCCKAESSQLRSAGETPLRINRRATVENRGHVRLPQYLCRGVSIAHWGRGWRLENLQSFIAGPYSSNHRRQKLPVGSLNIERSCPQSHPAPGCPSQRNGSNQHKRERTGEQSGRGTLELRLRIQTVTSAATNTGTNTAEIARIWRSMVDLRQSGKCEPTVFICLNSLVWYCRGHNELCNSLV